MLSAVRTKPVSDISNLLKPSLAVAMSRDGIQWSRTDANDTATRFNTKKGSHHREPTMSLERQENPPATVMWYVRASPLRYEGALGHHSSATLMAAISDRVTDDVDYDIVEPEGARVPGLWLPARWGLLLTSCKELEIEALTLAIARVRDICMVHMGSLTTSSLRERDQHPRMVRTTINTLMGYTGGLRDMARVIFCLVDRHNEVTRLLGLHASGDYLYSRVAGEMGALRAAHEILGCKLFSYKDRGHAEVVKLVKIREQELTQFSPSKTSHVRTYTDLIKRVSDDSDLAQLAGICTQSSMICPIVACMIGLALKGWIWNTDPEMESILRSVSPEGVQVGSYYPVDHWSRMSAFTGIELEYRRALRVAGTDIWVEPMIRRHLTLRLEMFCVRILGNPTKIMGYEHKASGKLNVLKDKSIRVLKDMYQNGRVWLTSLHFSLGALRANKEPPTGWRVAVAVKEARGIFVRETGLRDASVDLAMGTVNTVYSFACESQSAERFSKLHFMRMMRFIGPNTLVAEDERYVPLYKVGRGSSLGSWLLVVMGSLDPVYGGTGVWSMPSKAVMSAEELWYGPECSMELKYE